MTAFLSLAYHVPAATEDDWFKLEIVDSVLTGAGRNGENKTSRLYKALVKTGLAVSIDGGLTESLDPFLYELTITLNDGVSHEEAEAVILAEIERIQNEGISAEELQRAKKQARASFAFSTVSVTNQAYWLAQSAMLGDLRWYDSFLERLNAVTLEDVQEAAQTYLTPKRRIVGYLLPTGGDEEEYEDEEAEDAPEEPRLRPLHRGDRRPTGDGKQQQVVSNLLSNAVKFTPDRGHVGVALRPGPLSPTEAGDGRAIQLVVTVKLGELVPGGVGTRPDNRLAAHLEVSDSGIGIAREHLPSIFEPFFQVDSSSTREYGGSGLGLALAKAYVEAHGGRIWVDSTVGGGSRFVASFPVVQADVRAGLGAMRR